MCGQEIEWDKSAKVVWEEKNCNVCGGWLVKRHPAGFWYASSDYIGMDTLSLGAHTLTFVMAPMVHWPEVMVSYESTEKILFAADGFGKFGALDADEDWTCEARRYFINIVGKYGAQVQALLKKAATLDIAMIYPLHGPILKENLGYYIEKYDTWSSYRPEDKGILVAYASIHGNTRAAVEEFAAMLEAKGAEKVVVTDLARDDMAEAIEDAYRYDRLVVACKYK